MALILTIILITVSLRGIERLVIYIHWHLQVLLFSELVLNVLFNSPVNNTILLINVGIICPLSNEHDQEVFRDQTNHLVVHVEDWESMMR